MKTLLRLEDSLEDSPQMRSLLGLFEEDSDGLWSYTNALSGALRRMAAAQMEMTNATQNLAQVLASYPQQNLPLDQTVYEMPSIATKLFQTFNEMASWMELVSQQMTNCVVYPVEKFAKELDTTVTTFRELYGDASAMVDDAEMRYHKVGRKDSAKRMEEANNDVVAARQNYHEVALQYFTRLNSIQFMRYTQSVEPLLALVYAFRSFFHMGNDTLNQDSLSGFLQATQEQIQSVHKDYASQRRHEEDYLEVASQLKRIDLDLYAAQPASPHRILDVSLSHKQAYVYMKHKSGLFTTWDRYYLFTQGAQLMCQKREELGGQCLIDLATVGTAAEMVEQEERRFTFEITTPGSGVKSNRILHYLFQAKNDQDCAEWVIVINNLSGNSIGVAVANVTSTANADATPDNTQFTASGLDEKNPVLFALDSDDGEHGDAVVDDPNDGYKMRFLGSVGVLTESGDRMMHQTMRKVMVARAYHNIFKAYEITLRVADGRLTLVDNESTAVKRSFPIEAVTYWAAHPQMDKMFALIIKSGSGESENRTCYVFEANEQKGTSLCDVFVEATKKPQPAEQLETEQLSDQDQLAAAAELNDTGGQEKDTQEPQDSNDA